MRSKKPATRSTHRVKIDCVEDLPPVIVEWEDACLDTSYEGALDSSAGGTVILHDIGFLYCKNRRLTKLASCRCVDPQHIRQLTIIPTRLVRKITVLKGA